MSLWRRLIAGGQRLLRRRAFEQDLDDELRHYLEMATEEGMRSGLSREQAAREARLELRGVESVKQQVRSWGWEATVESVFQDVRIAARGLRRNPGFASVAILSLALGIGAATALFSVADGVLLKRLSVRDPDQLVVFSWTSGRNPPGRNFFPGVAVDPASGAMSGRSFSYLTWERLGAAGSALTDVFGVTQPIALGDPGAADRPTVQFVTRNYFAALGLETRDGRLLTSEDDRETGEPVAVISHRFWDRQFGRDPAVIGRSIQVGEASVTIVGVTPVGFAGVLLGEEPDLTAPLAQVSDLAPRAKFIGNLANQPWVWGLRLMGRLAPGATLEGARAQLQPGFAATAMEGLNRWPRVAEIANSPDVPELHLAAGGQGFSAGRDVIARAVTLMTWIVGLTLAIVCFNVANMLAARGATRRSEFAVRLATGAPRTRLVRQLITESLLMVGCGATLGTLFAFWAKDLFLSWITRVDPRFAVNLVIDARVLAFAAGAAIVTGVWVGVTPALGATRVELVQSMKGVGGRNKGDRSPINKMLLAAQVAVSVVLLIGAGLFARTLLNLRNADVGFETDNLLLFQANLTTTSVSRAGSGPGLYEALIDRLQALPGVRMATLSTHSLLSGEIAMPFVDVPGRAWGPGEERTVNYQQIAPNFFETMGIPLLRGRSLTRDDVYGGGRTVVVNEMLARRFFGTEEPIGRRLGISKGLDPVPDSLLLEIVGVVGDAKYTTVREDAPPTVFSAYATPMGAAYAVRTSEDPRLTIPSIREAVRQVAPDLAVSNFRTQQEAAQVTFARERHFATLAALSGAVAVALTCIGLYGLLSYSVTNRGREIGIRMALGARRGRVLGLVLGETAGLLSAGVLFGVGASWVAGRAIATQLYELPPQDPLSTGIAILLIAGAAGAAALLPARRASRIDPAVTLRQE